MLLAEERALMADLQDQIIDLLVEKDEARCHGDERRVAELQGEIDRLSAECLEVRRAAE